MSSVFSKDNVSGKRKHDPNLVSLSEVRKDFVNTKEWTTKDKAFYKWGNPENIKHY